MSNEKRKLLEALAVEYRASTPSKGFKTIGSFPNGLLYQPPTCPYVSPYTRGACNLDAEVFILLQDWASEDWLQGPFNPTVARLGRDPTLATNRNLEAYLREHFKLQPQWPGGLDLEQTFATNLFPFVKPGKMKTAISREILLDAANRFAIPQINIIKPRLVICLGLATFNAVREAVVGRPFHKRISDAIDSPFKMDSGPLVWCQAHTGWQGQTNRNRDDKKQTSKDWRKMAETYRA